MGRVPTVRGCTKGVRMAEVRLPGAAPVRQPCAGCRLESNQRARLGRTDGRRRLLLLDQAVEEVEQELLRLLVGGIVHEERDRIEEHRRRGAAVHVRRCVVLQGWPTGKRLIGPPAQEARRLREDRRVRRSSN